jgi:hypothetical protein
MSQHIQSEWDHFVMIHRYEDLALIRSVLRDLAPERVIELGTAEGGFAAFLACTVIEWDGRVLSLDKLPPDPGHAAWFAETYQNLTLVQAEILEPTVQTIELLQDWFQHPYCCLYTDNGNKVKELEMYVPLMHEIAMVGSHDYGTELPAVWANDFMASQRFKPYRHEEFAALANPEYYPDSLTRFWVRGLE